MSWEWKSDLRLTDDKSDGWTPYDAAVAAKIEKAYQKGQKTMTLDETYKIDFKDMVQHRKEDRNRQRPIRRVGDFGDAIATKNKETKAVAAAPAKKAAAPAKKAATKKAAPKKNKKRPDDDEDDDDDDDAISNDDGVKKAVKPPPKKKAKTGKGTGGSNISKFPVEFECKTGRLLWGQLHTVIEGDRNSKFRVNNDGRSGPASAGNGGTIVQNNFTYCCAARPGKWMARRLFMNGSQIGYIVHHADEDPMLMALATKEIAFGRPDPEKKVVCINRYDWGYHHGNGADDIAQVFGRGDDDDGDDDEFNGEMTGQRFMVVDSGNMDLLVDAIQPFKKRGLTGRDVVFAEDGNAYGVHLSMSETEYELGWMFYSGNKHPTFSKADECVGFLYDGAYCLDYAWTEGDKEPEFDVV